MNHPTIMAMLPHDTIAPLLWDVLLKGTVLMVLAGMAVLLMHRCSAALRHLVWVLALAGFVLLPFGAAALPAWRVLLEWSSMEAAPTAANASTTSASASPSLSRSHEAPATVTSPASDALTLPTLVINGATQQHGSPTDVSARTLPWMGLLWFTGMALFALRLILAHVLLRQAARRSRPITTGPIADAVHRAARQLGLRIPPCVFLDSQDRIPLVWGIFLPKLLLPAQATSWEDERLNAVLLHELAHVRRRDTASRCFAQVVCAIFWFHPLVWLAAWRLHMEGEQASDDLVLHSGMRSSTYAENLLHLATHLAAPRGMHAGGLTMARPSQLETRLHAILESRTNRRRVSPRHAIMAVVFTLALLIPLSMLHAAEQKDSKPSGQPESTPPKESASVFSSEPKEPWTANGYVIDDEGKPMEGVEIWVHAGMGSLFRTGVTTTDKDGNYKVSFGRGIMMPLDTPNLQVVNITAHKPGWSENNLNRHGAGAGALREVTAADLESYGITADKLVLPDKPRTVNFIMKRAAKLRITLTGTGSFPNLPPQAYRVKDTEKPIAGYRLVKDAQLTQWKLWLTGKELPPGCGVLASGETNDQGEVVFEDVPTDMAWHIQADTHKDHKEPISKEFVLYGDKEIHLHLHLNEDQKQLMLTPPTTEKMKELLRSPFIRRFKVAE